MNNGLGAIGIHQTQNKADFVCKLAASRFDKP